VTTGPPAIAATRPPDVSTVYTAPRTSVSAYATSTQPPAYGSSSTIPGPNTSGTGSPGSSPAMSTPMMTNSPVGVSSVVSGSSSLVNPPYGGSSSASVLPGASSTRPASVPVGSLSLSVNSVTGSNPVSPPSQYTNTGGASSAPSSAMPPPYSNPGVPSASMSGAPSPTNGGVPGSSSGMATSISGSSLGAASSNGPTPNPYSSARGVTMPSSSVNLPGVSTSGNVPPVYGSSSAVPPPSNNSPPPYGQSTASPVSSGSSLPFSSPSGNAPPPYGGSTTAPAPTTSSVAPPAETLCPGYNSRNYTDSSGATYTVYCGKGLTGTRYTPTYRRPAQSYTIQSCMDECNQYTACVAASTDGTSCNLFSSVTGSTSSPGTVAAYKVSGPPPSNVQTVTVCANRVTAYATVWTTATHTTCPADSTCTAASNYDNGFIGTQRARR
jgi:hypothetical protein